MDKLLYNIKLPPFNRAKISATIADFSKKNSLKINLAASI